MRRALSRTASRKRRGLGVLSDLTWLLVFVVLVMLLYFLGFYPLAKKNLENTVQPKRIVNNIEQDGLTNVRSDAQFTALALLEQQASPGTSGERAVTFGDAATTVLREVEARRARIDLSQINAAGPGGIPANPERMAFANFDSFVDESSYAATLDAIFAPDGPYWNEPMQYQSAAGVLAGVAVVLFVDGERLDETCREYAHETDYAAPVCELSKKESWVANEYSDAGYVHLPLESTTGTVYVYMLWRGRE